MPVVNDQFKQTFTYLNRKYMEKVCHCYELLMFWAEVLYQSKVKERLRLGTLVICSTIALWQSTTFFIHV